MRGVIMRHYQQSELSHPLPASVAEGESDARTIVAALMVCAIAASVYILS
jgi:hypothetical protein